MATMLRRRPRQRTTARKAASAGRPNYPTIFWLTVLHLGALAAPWTFSWSGLVWALVLGWVSGGLGICLGFHRLFTHRSFVAVRPLRWLIAVFGSLAGQGPLIAWVADHRKHHALSDRDGDPHSPRDGAWWSHVFWLAWTDGNAAEHHRRYAPDLLKEPVLVWIDRLFLFWHLLSGAALLAAGYWVGGWTLAWSWLVWGLFVRLVFVLHATWLVNSASHIWGYRNYATRDNSRNLWWVALLTYGEGWHNNHHAQPRAASNRHRWWEFDPTYLVIRLLAAIGLVREVVPPKPYNDPPQCKVGQAF